MPQRLPPIRMSRIASGARLDPGHFMERVARGSVQRGPVVGRDIRSLRSESFRSERFSGTRLKVYFELASAALCLYCHIRFQRNWQMRLGRTHRALFMFSKPSPKITGRPDIDVTILQAEKVDIPHGGSPPTLLAELRATLLRLSAFARQARRWPAARSRRRRMADGMSAFATSTAI